MRRLLIGLPLAGAMMTASIAYAQTPPPPQQEVPATPSAEEPTDDSSETTEQDGVQPERADCVDLADEQTAEGTTDEMQARLQSDDGAGAGTEIAPSESADDPEGQADVSEEEASSETPPVEGPDAGTAPGGSGSSAWTGGLGGSDIGTSQSEELETSPAPEPPAVASGLDPISGETAVEGPQAPPPAEDAAASPASDDDAQAALDC